MRTHPLALLRPRSCSLNS
uniref:Uncharacterized protein n=1 Tax=Rhizophora mucronata TaxID=61149 RepID=A0A2P2N8Q4_RHIMU